MLHFDDVVNMVAGGSMMNQRAYLRPLLISRKLPQYVEGFKRE